MGEAIVDLGDAALIIPGGLQTARHELRHVLRDRYETDPRSTVPVMAERSERHPRLNLLNLGATATGLVLDATMLLSIEAARGVLPEILDAENIRWRTVEID